MQQAIMQNAAPPPGLPPGMPPKPPGMPPGAPGAAMIPQAVTPPSGGGIPAEMQNQLTPEALGMPAGTDPLTFAGLTGREIPEADKLKILAGNKNVGNKAEHKGKRR